MKPARFARRPPSAWVGSIPATGSTKGGIVKAGSVWAIVAFIGVGALVLVASFGVFYLVEKARCQLGLPPLERPELTDHLCGRPVGYAPTGADGFVHDRCTRYAGHSGTCSSGR